MNAPYKDLFIYYLSGCPELNCESAWRDFLGNWEEDGYSFLFFSRPAPGRIERILRSQPELTLLDRYQMTYEEWHGAAPAPFSVGSLTVAPPWMPPSEPHAKASLLLDPGLAFGTGTHPTTRHCLEALQLFFQEHCADTVLDIGTGTGLLALAAAHLGGKRVVAADLNALAVKTALKNVRLNHMEKRILVVRGDAEKLMDLSNDLMISNIHYDVMHRLISAEGFAKVKRFILSGLLRSEALKIESQLNQLGARLIRTWQSEGIWHTYYGEIV